MYSAIVNGKETKVLKRHSSNGIFDTYSLMLPKKVGNTHLSAYKLHISLSANDYERAENLLKQKLHEYLKSSENRVLNFFKCIISNAFKEKKSLMHQQLMQELTRYAHQQPEDFLKKPSSEVTNRFREITIRAHSTLRFTNAEQFTLYLKPNAAIEGIVKLISDIEDFLVVNNIAPGQTPEFEWPLTTYFSFRKERVNGEYLDIYDKRYISEVFPNPKAEPFYVKLSATLWRRGIVKLNNELCQPCCFVRVIDFAALMLVEAQKEKDSNVVSAYTRLLLLKELFANAASSDCEVQPDVKRVKHNR